MSRLRTFELYSVKHHLVDISYIEDDEIQGPPPLYLYVGFVDLLDAGAGSVPMPPERGYFPLHMRVRRSFLCLRRLYLCKHESNHFRLQRSRLVPEPYVSLEFSIMRYSFPLNESSSLQLLLIPKT